MFSHQILMIESYLFSTLDQQNSIRIIKAFYCRIVKILEQEFENQHEYTPALSAIIEVSLNTFYEHRSILSGCLDDKGQSLDLSRQYHLEVMLRPFRNPPYTNIQDRDRRYHFGYSLELLAKYVDLLGIHPDLPHSKCHDETLFFDNPTQFLVSRQLFGNDGLLGSIKEHGRVFEASKTERISRDRSEKDYSVEYLLARLTKVEVLLGARDSNLHPGLIDASQRIYECKV